MMMAYDYKLARFRIARSYFAPSSRFPNSVIPIPKTALLLDLQDYDDPEELLRQNRAYLEWEMALIDQLPGDPAAA